MTEDLNTKDLTNRELFELMRSEMHQELNSMRQDFNERLENVYGRLDQVDGRLGTLEARTNPLPPNYDARFTALERDVKGIKRDMELLRDHDWQRERELADVKDRVKMLESVAA